MTTLELMSAVERYCDSHIVITLSFQKDVVMVDCMNALRHRQTADCTK